MKSRHLNVTIFRIVRGHAIRIKNLVMEKYILCYVVRRTCGRADRASYTLFKEYPTNTAISKID